MHTESKQLSKQPKGRLLALDILRGITIAGMILVNNPGSWAKSMLPPPRRVERPYPYRPRIPVLYVHHGGLHVFLASEI